MHADFCVEALQEAIAKYGPPEIFNTDRGSQFTGGITTGSALVATLTKARVRISMDGRCRYFNNIFIERLWRSLKQEEISDGFQARRVVKNWMTFYNTERPHSALDRLTPDDAYWAGLKEQKAA